MMKSIVALFCLVLLASGVQAQKQQTTPIPTPRPAEATMEATSEAEEALRLSDILEEVPQSRSEDGAFVLGDPDAPVTIVIFADWACPHCQVYREAVEPMLIEYLLAEQVKLEHRTFPTAGGTLTVYAAQVAECADDLHEGGFWHSHDLLYELAIAGEYDADTMVETLAETLDVDADALETCALDAQQIAFDFALVQESGLQGTPAVMIRYGDGQPEFIEIGDQLYNRGGVPVDILQAAIEAGQERSAASGSSK